MEWYYAEGQQQRGPVTEEELRRLVVTGTIKDETLVWREGMRDWQAFGQVRPSGTATGLLTVLPVAVAAAATVGAGTAGGIVCSQCGRTFPQDEVIRYGELCVCAGCKPVFLQRLREGAELTGGPGQMATEEQVLARDYTVSVGDYLSQAWDSFKNNPGMIIGATVLVYLALIASNVIPYLNVILALVFSGPLMGGLWLFFIKIARGEGAGLREAFGGFSPRFGQLLLAHLVSSILAGLCIVPMFVTLAVWVVTVAAGSRGGGDPSIGMALIVSCLVLGLVGTAGMIYLSVSWMYSLPLVADKGLSFWSAMSLSRRVVAKHWWGTLWLAIVVGVICLLGLFACVIGLLVAAPVGFGALAFHYRKVFGDLAPVYG